MAVTRQYMGQLDTIKADDGRRVCKNEPWQLEDLAMVERVLGRSLCLSSVMRSLDHALGSVHPINREERRPGRLRVAVLAFFFVL